MKHINVSQSRTMKVMRIFDRHKRISLRLITLVCPFWFGALVSRADTHYVAHGGQVPSGTYLTWDAAASNIQDAIGVTGSGDTVLVSNGVYETGGVTNWPSGSLLTNRVAITNAIIVRSANNEPANTIIKGAGPNGAAAVRCVYMADGSSLIGFMVTNGATLSSGDGIAGGVYCQSTAATISNCMIVSNLSYGSPAGVYNGTLYNCQVANNESLSSPAGAAGSILYNCTIANNKITSGGAYFYGLAVTACILSNCTISGNIGGNGSGAASWGSMMYNCTVTGNAAWGCGGVQGGTNFNCTFENNNSDSGNAGGANGSTLYNCILRNNYSGWQDSAPGAVNSCTLYNCLLVGNRTSGNGGGAHNSTLYNCLIVSNSVGVTGYPDRLGGGAYNCTLYNCTIVSNWIAGAGAAGGGACTSTLYNCISWGNESGDSNITASYSCGVDYTNGGSVAGNITNTPLFVNSAGGNYRLNNNSPCVNKGTNQSWMTTTYPYDLDGRTRIRYGTVDMGAYELIHEGTIYNVH